MADAIRIRGLPVTAAFRHILEQVGAAAHSVRNRQRLHRPMPKADALTSRPPPIIAWPLRLHRSAAFLADSTSRMRRTQSIMSMQTPIRASTIVNRALGLVTADVPPIDPRISAPRLFQQRCQLPAKPELLQLVIFRQTPPGRVPFSGLHLFGRDRNRQERIRPPTVLLDGRRHPGQPPASDLRPATRAAPRTAHQRPESNLPACHTYQRMLTASSIRGPLGCFHVTHDRPSWLSVANKSRALRRGRRHSPQSSTSHRSRPPLQLSPQLAGHSGPPPTAAKPNSLAEEPPLSRRKSTWKIAAEKSSWPHPRLCALVRALGIGPAIAPIRRTPRPPRTPNRAPIGLVPLPVPRHLVLRSRRRTREIPIVRRTPVQVQTRERTRVPGTLTSEKIAEITLVCSSFPREQLLASANRIKTNVIRSSRPRTGRLERLPDVTDSRRRSGSQRLHFDLTS